MPANNETMVSPQIERLLERASSKFRLVTLSARRARQVNAYFGQLGDGLGATVPPQVTSSSRKPLSIAFEEIDADKIIGVDLEEVEDAVDDATETDPGDDAS